MTETTVIEIELDEAREVMFNDLAEMLGEDAVKEEIKSTAQSRLTQIYDNKDQLQVNQQQL